MAEALSPRNHPFGTKRPCLDDGYYATYNLPHVRLVDLRRTPIETVDETGVRTSAEHVDLDVLVLATGFDAMTGAVLAVDPVGRGGQRLSEAWAEGPSTYLGSASPGSRTSSSSPAPRAHLCSPTWPFPSSSTSSG